MNIRKLEEKDRTYVVNMMRGFYDSPAVIHKVPEAVLHQNVEDCIGACPFVEGYVLEDDSIKASEQVVGYTMIAKSYSTEFGGMCVWFEDIYMEPAYRGKGLVTQIFEYIEALYVGKVVRYRLEVACDNIPAIKAYKKHGYGVLEYIEMTKEI